MKKLMMLAGILAFAVVSCKKSSDSSSDSAIPCDNVAAFTAVVDANGKGTFTDISTGHVSTWLWNFGDNKTSTEKNPVHNYTKAGTYNVILTVNNSKGTCSQIKSSKVNVPFASSFAIPSTYTKKVLV